MTSAAAPAETPTTSAPPPDDAAALVLEAVRRSVVPPLTYASHKGQQGRIGVLGGCAEYTGAPYYAGLSALRCGADLCHVFCTSGAAVPIKSYSPELIVHAVMPDAAPTDAAACADAVAAAVRAVAAVLPSLDALVIGPGLGRAAHVQSVAAGVLQRALEAHVPLVVDGDGLWLVAHDLSLVRGQRSVLLTPNAAEYSRLAAALAGRPVESARATDEVPPVEKVAAALEGPTVLQKGARCAQGADLICGPDGVLLRCVATGSPRRCGGQGDVLAGTSGTFCAWLAKHNKGELTVSAAALAAAAVTRGAARLAFESMKRATLTTDVIQCVGDAFEELFGEQ